MGFNEFDILLIDDDEDDYFYLKDLFSQIAKYKYNITWKSSYKEGLEALHNKHFDVCLLDYRLGEHTGIELLTEVHKLNYVCPIIVLTGYGDFDLDVQAMQMGAAEYLVKSQLTAPLLERSVRYTMKHALDKQELKESKAQIIQQDRLASLGLLASSLAHEIGTPLGVIRSRSELAGKRTTDEVLKNDMKTVITQIDKITKLVNSLLNLAREKKSESAGSINVSKVINDVLNFIQFELNRNNIFLEVNMSEDLNVIGEAGPLGQVVLNLLINAIHAIEEANKKGRKEKHKILLTVKTHLRDVEISIQDTGCGIPEKNLSQLFKPFFTTKAIGEGTGLGLATSYKIVNSWNGSLSVESQEDVGSTFKVKLVRAPN